MTFIQLLVGIYRQQQPLMPEFIGGMVGATQLIQQSPNSVQQMIMADNEQINRPQDNSVGGKYALLLIG
jgi:hypothetical protein